MPQYRNPKKICSRIGLALFAMLGVWQIASALLQTALSRAAPHLLRGEWSAWLLNSGPLYLLGLPVFLLILHFVPDGPIFHQWRPAFGPKHYLLAMVFCFGATYLINIGSSAFIVLLQYIFGGGHFLENALDSLVGQSGLLPNFVFGVVVPSVGEEFIFRYMLRRKLQGCSDIIYIFFSGLCFAMFHANLSQTLYAFVVGSLFAWAYLVTGNFIIPVSMHFLVNLVGVILAPLLLESTSALIIFGGIIVSLIVGAIVIFVSAKSWFFSALQPPAEAGWPYRPSVPTLPAHSPYRAPGGVSPYVAWYSLYAQQATASWKYPYQNVPLLPTNPVARTGFYPPPIPQAPYHYGAYPYGNEQRAATIVLKNVGMVLFLCATGLLLVFNLLLMTVV